MREEENRFNQESWSRKGNTGTRKPSTVFRVELIECDEDLIPKSFASVFRCST